MTKAPESALPEPRRLKGAGTRLLVATMWEKDYFDLIRTRFPELEMQVSKTYAEIAPKGAQLKPQVLFTCRTHPHPYPREAALGTPGVRWIAVSGAGCEFLTPWDPQAITVTNGAGVTADTLAQYAIGAIIAFSSRLPSFWRRQAKKEWSYQQVERIKGKTVGVIGLGHIGQAVAKKAAALEMRVLGVRARPAPMAGVDEVVGPDKMLDVLRQSDVVVSSVPSTPETRKLFDRRTIAVMKPGCIFINLARGAVADQEALIEALRNGPIGYAALDVFEKEPLPPESPLWTMENVLVTPHCISDYKDWQYDSVALFCDNLDRWLAGRPLFNVVDPERGY
ncbi:MAG: D-2-hydroxyacid dehydrogenase [Rhodospirillales bacterium]|nr:D-2-hydroxyacid dehydrogenase [Rhodospirillales bacterium]